MREPTRLLETPRSGLERDLLRSALTEVAPAAARARVLQSIDAVLGGASLAGSAEPYAAGSDLPGSAAPQRRLALRSVQAVVLSGALAVAAGASVVLQHWAGQGATRAEPSSVVSVRPAAAPTAAAPRLLTPAPAAPLASLRAMPGALANTSSEDPRLGANSSVSPRSHGEMRREPPAKEDEAATKEELPTDWLGAQLQLLGQVRDLLGSGRLEQASSLLDEYEQRFPEGVVGPQIVRLRADLRERRSSSGMLR